MTSMYNLHGRNGGMIPNELSMVRILNMRPNKTAKDDSFSMTETTWLDLDLWNWIVRV